MMVWGFHPQITNYSLKKSVSQLNHDNPIITSLTFSGSQNRARSLKLSKYTEKKKKKKESLECFKLVYLSISTMLRCWGSSDHVIAPVPVEHTRIHEMDQTMSISFMSTWHGQESEIQNVPGLGSGFLYPPCGALFPWVTGGSHSRGNTWEDRATWAVL